MLVSVNDVANRLKITNRAVQIKCKREGLVKIGNQYQITEEIIQKWIFNSEQKQRNEHEQTPIISHPKRKEVRSFNSFIIYLLIALLIIISVLFYIDLKAQIKDSNETIKKNDKEHKTEIKDLNKQLNNYRDVIQHQELQIQSLKVKDSLRFIKRW
jgi:uncharacterized protein HemX